MPQVVVTIAGKTYRMACDEGQESHLEALAERLDRTMRQLRDAFGTIGEQRLTVMTAIMVMDELVDAETRLADLTQRLESETPAAESEAAIALASERLARLTEKVRSL